MDFSEIIYEKTEGVARVTINRPRKYNACTTTTLSEILRAFTDAWSDDSAGVVVLTGSGDKAFCTGGDQSIRDEGGYEGGSGELPLEVMWQQVSQMIRTIPKPVIARVNGYAIGGGQVFQVVCDLSIASENARFGQVGPKVGSFDPGFGTGDLARTVGMKRAKEIWFLCRRYSAQQALEMGLVNAVVPHDKLDEETNAWCAELLEKSPTAIKMLKYAFHAETDGTAGITNLGVGGLGMYYNTEESMEGRNAFMEKRKPDFRKYK
ncbi:MAG: 1,4-dihydroxy-2-naphthoyl-CoA synthase [Desulfosalsimonas sp.]